MAFNAAPYNKIRKVKLIKIYEISDWERDNFQMKLLSSAQNWVKKIGMQFYGFINDVDKFPENSDNLSIYF